MEDAAGEEKIREIAEYIAALAGEGGRANRLIVEGGSGWAVLLGMKGEPHIDCELAANAHLAAAGQLSEEQLRALHTDGFIRPHRGSARRHQVFALPEGAGRLAAAEGIARRVAGWLASLYGAEPGRLRLRLELGEDEGLDNAPLREAMRQASRLRSHEARLDLYRALINATFLLRVDSPGGTTPAAIEQMGPWVVVAAFTDHVSLRAYDPRGVPVRRLYGHELFAQLLAGPLPVGSLKINPEGDVGGELYRNEIETIAQAVRRFHAPRR